MIILNFFNTLSIRKHTNFKTCYCFSSNLYKNGKSWRCFYFPNQQVRISACCSVILTEGNYFISLEGQRTELHVPTSLMAFVFLVGVRSVMRKKILYKVLKRDGMRKRNEKKTCTLVVRLFWSRVDNYMLGGLRGSVLFLPEVFLKVNLTVCDFFWYIHPYIRRSNSGIAMHPQRLHLVDQRN